MDSCPVQGESHTLIRLSRSTLRKLEISSGLMSLSGSSGKDLGFFLLRMVKLLPEIYDTSKIFKASNSCTNIKKK